MTLICLAILAITLFAIECNSFRCHFLVRRQLISKSSIFGYDNRDVIRETSDAGFSSSLLVSDVSQFGINTALAEEHIALGNLEDAEKLATKAMEIAKHTGEENSIYAAYAEGILADALYRMGSYKEAAEHYHSALKIYEIHSLSSSGPEAVELVGAVQLVAWTFLSKKAYDEAKGACTAALAMTEKLLGPKALDVGASLVNLATAQMHTGTSQAETEALYLRALKIYQEAFDSIDIDEKTMADCRAAIGGIQSSLGNLYFLSRSDEKAKDAYMKVEQYYLRGYYTEIDAAAPMKNLAMLEWKQGNNVRAELLLARAMLIVECSKDFGTIHPQYRHIASLLEELRRGSPPPMLRRDI